MKMSLALQCLSVWDFTPIEDETKIYINDFLTPHIVKRGGYRVITMQLPNEFHVRVQSKNYHSFETFITNPQNDKIVLCELIKNYVPLNSVVIKVLEPSLVALCYDYFYLEQSLFKNQSLITIKNPDRVNLEGQRFLLFNTITKVEEEVALGDALDIYLTEFKLLKEIQNDYEMSSTVLLRAFYSNSCKLIPIKRTNGECAVWIYNNEQTRKVELL